MKILHVITSLKVGGAESALYNFLAQSKLTGKNEHIVAYFYNGPNRKKIEQLGIKTYSLCSKSLTYGIKSWRKLQELVDNYQPALLHSALWSANIFTRLFAYWNGISHISDLHGNSYDEGMLRNIIDRMTVSMSTRIVAVADNVAHAYTDNIIGKNTHLNQRLVTIKNGINRNLFLKKSQSNKIMRCDIGLNVHDFVIGAIGRLEPIKSYDILIRSFAALVNVLTDTGKLKLCIVGDGSQRYMLEQLAQELGVADKVIFLGFRSDYYALYNLFDCFALSSQSEGLSIALLEAMAIGLPIITTNRTSSHEVIINQKNGLLIPINDIERYMRGLRELYENPILCKTMGHFNKLLLKEKYQIKNVVDQYDLLYSKVVKPC